MQSSKYVIGISVGGTKLAVVISDSRGEIIERIRKPTNSERGPENVIQRVFDMVNEIIRIVGLDKNNCTGVGVSFGGPVNPKTGTTYSFVNCPGWGGIPLKKRIEVQLGLPVVIENDANASALAEWMYGAGRGYDYVVYMTMGTGIGGGIVVKGRLYKGTGGLAGEVGHQILLPNGPKCECGKRGCLESLCSGPAITRRAKEAIKKDPKTLILRIAEGKIENVKSEMVVRAARDGDRLANQLIYETATYMGWGIANIVSILNPDVVILGTVATAAGDLLLAPIRENVRKLGVGEAARRVKILPSQLGDQIDDLAAVSLVIRRFQEA